MLPSSTLSLILKSFYKGLCSFSILMGDKNDLEPQPKEVSLGEDWICVGHDFTSAIMKFEAKKHERDAL